MTVPYAPSWLTPSAPGQLCNAAIPAGLAARYINPAAGAEKVGAIRVVATRTVQSGFAQFTPETVWDSGWVGNAATHNMPQAVAGMGVVQSGNRVYQIGGGTAVGSGSEVASCRSAAIDGFGGVGGWRNETPLPGARSFGMAAVVNGYVIFAGGSFGGSMRAEVWSAPINADGTLGAWTPQAALPEIRQYGVAVGANGYIVVAGGQVSGVATNVTSVRYAQVVNGTITTWVNAANSLGTAVTGASAFFEPIGGYMFVLGGQNAVPAVITTAQVSKITAGVPGVWGTTVALNVATNFAASTFVAGANGGSVYLMGGDSTVGPNGTQITTIQAASVASNGTITAWTTSGVGLPAGRDSGGGAFTSDPFKGHLIHFGGIISTAVTTNIVYSSPTAGAPGTAPTGFVTGPGTALVSADLGAGGVVAVDADGSNQDLTWTLGNFGVAPLLTLNNGDQITLAVQFMSILGDVSPSTLTAIKIGQPPAISGISPSGATADGRPLVSFIFAAGAGGDVEFSYRIQVAPNGFDSGTRYDLANSVQLLSAAYLPTTILQTITVTVVSRDQPMAGSTNQAVLTGTFTPTMVGPGTPTALTATPNNPLGKISLAWTNNAPAGTTPGNRVYYRRNGTVPWFLLADLPAAATTFDAIDQIALAVAYDFAVSQVDNSNHSESALSGVATATVNPVTGGYSGFWHVQGQGTAHFAPLLVQGTPDVTAILDTTATLPFQQLTPSVTLGVAHYARLKLKVLVPTLANQKQIMDVIATAYAGAVIVYRDGFGGMATFQLAAEQTETYLPPVARESNLSLVQIPNQLQPSTLQGSATGYLQQVFNSIVPLDPSEAFL